jgi:hypothetical protein
VEEPPSWLRWRGEQISGHGRKYVIYAATWKAAQVEATARNVPIVLVLPLPHAKRLPSKLSSLRSLLNEEVVAVACMPPHASPPPKDKPPRGGGHPPRGGGHPPRGGGGGRKPPPPPPEKGGGQQAKPTKPDAKCPLFRGQRCGNHMEIQRGLGSRYRPEGEPQVVVLSSDGQKTLKTYGERSIGRLKRDLKSLRARGPYMGKTAMLAAGRVWSGEDKTGNKKRSDDAKGAAALAKALGAPTLVGDWARLALRNYCDAEIAAAKGSTERLEKLLALCAKDPACKDWVEVALAEAEK